MNWRLPRDHGPNIFQAPPCVSCLVRISTGAHLRTIPIPPYKTRMIHHNPACCRIKIMASTSEPVMRQADHVPAVPCVPLCANPAPIRSQTVQPFASVQPKPSKFPRTPTPSRPDPKNKPYTLPRPPALHGPTAPCIKSKCYPRGCDFLIRCIKSHCYPGLF